MLSGRECYGTQKGHQRRETVREGEEKVIDSVEFKTFINKRTSTFTIATGSSSSEENVIVKVVAGDEYGVGNANPTDVTKETVTSIEDFLSKLPKKMIGTDENEPERLHQRLDSIA